VSADARPPGSAVRGRLRIYLGYAPGVGTTRALLSEGQRRAKHGTDMVVASAETHGRPPIEDLLAGLEVIPSAKVRYRGTLAEEMDLGAVLACRPAVALVDDLAHRNTPSSRHSGRPGRPAGSGRSVLAAQRRLAESAGGTYHQLADEDIPAALLAFAHAHNATQLVLGATPRTWLAALRPAVSIRSRVIRHGGGLDVHIVTCQRRVPTTVPPELLGGSTR
jgi:K+-sensing histidine kinase KdpD